MTEPTTIPRITGLLLQIAFPPDSTSTRKVYFYEAPTSRGIIKIGRDVRSQLVLNDEGVSRAHAVIERTDAGPNLIDLGSGTRLTRGGHTREINREDLKAGDIFEIGKTRIEVIAYLTDAPPAERATPAPPRNEVPPPPMPSSTPPPVNRRRAPPPPTRVTLLQVLAWTTWSATKRIIARGVRALRAIEAADSLGDK